MPRPSRWTQQNSLIKGANYLNSADSSDDTFQDSIRARDVKSAQVFQHLHQYINGVSPLEDAWLHEPDIPTAREIGSLIEGHVTEIKKDLQPNLAFGPWASKDFYLQSQYQLFREDGIAPLREAVDEVRQQPRLVEKDSVEHAHIYESVFVLGVNLGRKGLTVKVEFSMRRAEKRIRWAQSARLKSGTIVALSPVRDCFQSICKVAVVAARPLVDLEVELSLKPAVHLEFSDPNEVEIDPQKEWIMVEASAGYWEAYRHTLKALQKLHGESFPLARHIVDLETDVSHPAYRQENPEIDLNPVCDTPHPKMSSVNILDEWPDLTTRDDDNKPLSKLDESQLSALRRILTKSLAIVQGPPGTGKTHVSVEALRALLANASSEDPPIIVSAHTNHALDQLLRHVARFEPEFVRLGGQTTDKEVILPRTMQMLREASRVPQTSISRQANSLEKQLAGQLKEALIPLMSESPFSAEVFFDNNVISRKQLESLERIGKNWVGENFHGTDDKMSMFFEDQIKPFTRANEAALFDEYEEYDEFLKSEEEDLETAFNDDRFETLRGKYISFKEGFVPEAQNECDDRLAERTLSRQPDLAKIPIVHRGSLYSYMQEMVKAKLLVQIRAIATKAKAMCQSFQIGRWEKDHMLLEKTKVIGMTTTGLSKYRALVTSLKPKIILIEEAAETLEAYTAAAFLPSLEHMILVGDHQQLRGHCNVKEFESAPWNLDISMFERFVRNNIEFTQLKMQRRMRPEIREIINPIYKELTDHPSVLERSDVPGMGGVNTCFLTHNFPESNDDALSKQNIHEARLIVGFCYYLYLNGTDTSKITILTFYNGQRKLIGKLISQHKMLANLRCNVATVDSYQGEENDVVLLSMVRNNNRGQIGFLSVENRVCVALSRARCGFYVFGDAISVYQQNQLWHSVLNIMGEKQGSIRKQLPLTCQNHGIETMIYDAGHFDEIDGGCRKKCNEQRPCGHTCKLRCHPQVHEDIACEQRCTKRLACGHLCSSQCWYREHECLACDPKPIEPIAEVVRRTPSPRKTKRDDGLGTSRAGSPTRVVPGQLPPTPHGKAFREFAAGGVREADARLRETNQKIYNEAVNRAALESMAKKKIRPRQEIPVASLEQIDKPNMLGPGFPDLPTDLQPHARQKEPGKAVRRKAWNSVAKAETGANSEDVLVNIDKIDTQDLLNSDFLELPSRLKAAAASQSTRKKWTETWMPPAVEKKIEELKEKTQAPTDLLD